MKNTNNYLFHPSDLPILMSGAGKPNLTPKQAETLDKLLAKPKLTPIQEIRLQDLLKKKDAPSELPEGVKSKLLKIYLKQEWGIDEMVEISRDGVLEKINFVYSDALEKGTKAENDSISLYRKFTQTFSQKNEKKLLNDLLQGTPDILLDNKGVDIKTSSTIYSFLGVDMEYAKKTYYWQLVGYSYLTGIKNWELAFCLTNTPEEIWRTQMQRVLYRYGFWQDATEESEKIIQTIEDQFFRNNNFDNFPLQKRVKIYEFEIPYADIALMIERLLECRQYLENISI
jgi:hypothetical protein